MRVGLIIPTGYWGEFAGWHPPDVWKRVLDIARLAERLGFDSLWVGEHLAPKWDREAPLYDGVPLMTAIASHVPRVDIGFVVLNTTFRNPAATAKMATAIDANGDGVLEFFGDFRNAGAGTMRGAEVEATVQASRYVRLLGHAGYLDTHYDAYFSRGVDMARTQRFPNAPDWTAGASTIGEWPLARGGAFVARLDGQYRSKAYPTTDINDFVLQGGYTLWNASLTWRSPGRGWEIALIGDNIFDKAYRTASFFLRDRGLGTGFYGAPRTFALSMTYSF